jgi:hypothetical protein
VRHKKYAFRLIEDESSVEGCFHGVDAWADGIDSGMQRMDAKAAIC